jgi:hypothetical protein
MSTITKAAKKIISGEAFVIIFPVMSFYFLKKIYRSYLKRLASKKLPMVIRIAYGGLGDHLVYSALPDILFTRYGVETEVSLCSEFRSREIKDFVWGTNPHVSFSSKKGKVIYIPKLKNYRNYNEVLVRLFSEHEENIFSVYYTPAPRVELVDKVICDLTYGPSGELLGYSEKVFWDAVVEYLKRNFKKEELVLLNPVGTYANKELLYYVQNALGIEILLSINSLYELADAIVSARDRVFFLSGAKSLASAYGKPSRVLDRGLLPHDYFHYPTNTYTII